MHSKLNRMELNRMELNRMQLNRMQFVWQKLQNWQTKSSYLATQSSYPPNMDLVKMCPKSFQDSVNPKLTGY